MKLALGVDCGGTNIKLALVEPAGKVYRTKLAAVSYRKTPRQVISDFAAHIRGFLRESGVGGLHRVGFGIAGDIDQDRGLVRFSPNLGWRGVPLKKTLEPLVGVPVLVDNDANCAAWGAYWLDAKKDCGNLVCLTLGTGIGGGIIVGGKLYRGATGSAGELGHMTIDYRGRRCRCGSRGCIESLAGAWGLVQTAKEGLRRGRSPLLRRMLKEEGAKLEPRTLARAARRGDPFCRRLWRDAGEQLGCALANCVNIFNPERIVLSGGVSKAGSLILAPALRAMKARAFAAPARAARVTISKYDEHLGVVGAALLLQE